MDTDLSSWSISVVDKLWTERRVAGEIFQKQTTLKFASPGITETVPIARSSLDLGDPERYLQQAFALSFRTIKAKLYRKNKNTTELKCLKASE